MPTTIKQTTLLSQVIIEALAKAEEARYEFLTPELFFYYGVLEQKLITEIWEANNIDCKKFRRELKRHISTLERVPKNIKYQITPSVRFAQMTASAHTLAQRLHKNETGLFEAIMATIYIPEPNIIKDILDKIANIEPEKLADAMFDKIFREEAVNDKIFELFTNITAKKQKDQKHKNTGKKQTETLEDLITDILGHIDDGEGIEIGITHIPADKTRHTPDDDTDTDQTDDDTRQDSEPWTQLVTRLNGTSKNHNPLIGREQELQRTIHILCKKERHNILYIGEPGVGKTAMIYGLIEALDKQKPYTPKHLSQAEIYQLNITDLTAGANYRGDFENRIKTTMEGISRRQSAIIYIDDIQHLIGLGAGGGDNNDAASMILPYLDMPNIRFIGTTGYKEYSQQIMRNKAFSRRFQTIEIKEPTTEQTIQILLALMPIYEKYHNIKFRNKKELARYAVETSDKYITNRYQPEKSIDLIDETGAYRQTHPTTDSHTAQQWVDKKLIRQMIQKTTSQTDIQDPDDDETKKLQKLADNIKNKIYGQDQAVIQITEAILMSKAGLLDPQKPIASFLFVGQTGVGKTEIAKVLARELGIELIRFDMSEYTEKHTVAKLIGSPAGYIGYDDGGLLTDAIRKSPNCVLLMDEIEKAHQDIYNILLQIMDYASLTDNKGQKSDFRHVILIMTSNAGAQYAHQATVGFNGTTAGSAMLTAVKKTFKPEFINRLSATVLFNDITEQTATQILQKKIDELTERLQTKKITLQLTDATFQELLRKGFSPQYGAREIDRVLNTTLTPLLTREILFGKLKKGGKARIDYDGKQITIQKA